MKLSKETLKRIIKEELEAAMDEGYKGMARKLGKAEPQDIPHLRRDGHHPDYPPKEVSDEERRQAIIAMLQSHYPGKSFRITDGEGNVLAQSDEDMEK
jgi:hypothetical protein|tara:strand:- start:75 stop:368 length:294 start_codon:yes stop_codon:yes gene_type:complete